MTAIGEALGVYDRLGFCVIPIRRGDKRPATEGSWAPYQQRRSLPMEWGLWWPESTAERNMDNIGVVTGLVSDLVVVDCDDESTYRTIVGAWPDLEQSMTVQTGKGWHIYLRPEQREGVKTVTFKLNDMTHHVKAEGGYVVAPPSIHATGRRYQFTNGHDPMRVDMTHLAQAILAVGGEPARVEAKDRPTNWYEELYEGPFGTGQRNDRMAQLGGLLRNYIPEERWALAYAIMRDWNQKYCKPPLPDAEVRATAFSISRYAPARRGYGGG